MRIQQEILKYSHLNKSNFSRSFVLLFMIAPIIAIPVGVIIASFDSTLLLNIDYYRHILCNDIYSICYRI